MFCLIIKNEKYLHVVKIHSEFTFFYGFLPTKKRDDIIFFYGE